MSIDPVALARFMLLNGASELVTAFAGIPEGPLRDSIVSHAQVIAHTYANPPTHGMGDPIQRIAPDPVAALAGPRRGRPSTDDPQVKAVQLMLEGVAPTEAAKRTGLDVKGVLAAKKAAKSAGVKFPSLKASKKPKGTVSFALELDGLRGQALHSIARAAAVRGIDLDAYMARRRLAMKMAQDGRHIRAIMEATKEPKTVLTSWFTTMRSAGHDVPYMPDAQAPHAAEPPPEPEPEAEVVSLDSRRPILKVSFYTTADELTDAGRRGAQASANVLRITVEEFLAKRARALELYRDGVGPAAVAEELGITRKMAENWKTLAKGAGLLETANADQAEA
jgi:hypothetical protein